jgi:hypothetical protein
VSHLDLEITDNRGQPVQVAVEQSEGRSDTHMVEDGGTLRFDIVQTTPVKPAADPNAADSAGSSSRRKKPKSKKKKRRCRERESSTRSDRSRSRSPRDDESKTTNPDKLKGEARRRHHERTSALQDKPAGAGSTGTTSRAVRVESSTGTGSASRGDTLTDLTDELALSSEADEQVFPEDGEEHDDSFRLRQDVIHGTEMAQVFGVSPSKFTPTKSDGTVAVDSASLEDAVRTARVRAEKVEAERSKATKELYPTDWSSKDRADADREERNSRSRRHRDSSRGSGSSRRRPRSEEERRKEDNRAAAFLQQESSAEATAPQQPPLDGPVVSIPEEDVVDVDIDDGLFRQFMQLEEQVKDSPQLRSRLQRLIGQTPDASAITTSTPVKVRPSASSSAPAGPATSVNPPVKPRQRKDSTDLDESAAQIDDLLSLASASSVGTAKESTSTSRMAQDIEAARSAATQLVATVDGCPGRFYLPAGIKLRSPQKEGPASRSPTLIRLHRRVFVEGRRDVDAATAIEAQWMARRIAFEFLQNKNITPDIASLSALLAGPSGDGLKAEERVVLSSSESCDAVHRWVIHGLTANCDEDPEELKGLMAAAGRAPMDSNIARPGMLLVYFLKEGFQSKTGFPPNVQKAVRCREVKITDGGLREVLARGHCLFNHADPKSGDESGVSAERLGVGPDGHAYSAVSAEGIRYLHPDPKLKGPDVPCRKAWLCGLCLKMYDTINKAQRCMAVHLHLRFMCGVCGAVSQSWDSAASHKKHKAETAQFKTAVRLHQQRLVARPPRLPAQAHWPELEGEPWLTRDAVLGPMPSPTLFESIAFYTLLHSLFQTWTLRNGSAIR